MDVRLDVSPRNLSSLPKKLRKKIQAKYKSALFRVAQIGINIIQDRTKQGKGYKDGAFKRYSEKYAAFRSEKGATLRPNLELSGNMMAAMTSKANYKRAEIFFRGKEESGKASGNNASRPFFGFSRDEQVELGKSFERFIK
tara:strand:+ start:64 stop:486 length:423 start_codon:yes stop_codon:yes gene_type:complete